MRFILLICSVLLASSSLGGCGDNQEPVVPDTRVDVAARDSRPVQDSRSDADASLMDGDLDVALDAYEVGTQDVAIDGVVTDGASDSADAGELPVPFPVTCNYTGPLGAGPVFPLHLGRWDTARGFVELNNGDAVEAQYGPQGGAMLVLLVRVPMAVLGSGSTCAQVEFQNGAPAIVGFERLAVASEGRQVGDAYEFGVFWNQIGWQAPAPGTTMHFGVAVNSANAHASGAYDLRFAAPVYEQPPGQDCSALEVQPGACAYRLFRGQGVVERIVDSPTTAARCSADSVQVEYRFELTDPQDSRCMLYPTQAVRSQLTWSGLNPARGCVPTTVGVGYTFPVTRRERVGGTCFLQALLEQAPPDPLADCESSCGNPIYP